MSQEFLAHIGVGHLDGGHSGRYPWGSGENPIRSKNLRSYVKELRAAGMTDTEIANAMEVTTTELRKAISNAKAEDWANDRARVLDLYSRGYSKQAIAEKTGIAASSVRNLLKEQADIKANRNAETADKIKNYVDEVNYVDVGPGAEIELGVSRTRLKSSIELLKEQGYQEMKVYVDQLGTNKQTTVSVLVKPGVEYQDLMEHKYDIASMGNKVIDSDHNITPGNMPVNNIDSSRVLVKYAEEGGVDKDGCIELRRGVEDLDLGRARYAQVRIGVDGTHYLKGMAVYSDDIPKGYDVVFNTNKHTGTPALGDDKDNTVLKKQKDDPANPFGASIKDAEDLSMVQATYIGSDGKQHVSALNIVNEEGDWSTWSRTLASQFLSKQSTVLAKKQLDITYQQKEDEFNDICALENPTVKKKLLESFADGCDADAVNLKAAALPRQAQHVIIPFSKSDIPDGEVYAPNYKNGESVVLVRYPYAGPFESPLLKVNNNNAKAKSILGNATDAIGINSSTAAKMSGADFDGDSVVVIPVNEKTKVRATKSLAGLVDFDPKEAYPAVEGMKRLGSEAKQIEMGKVTNLITDMTLQGASVDEITHAVKHSMVIIDAEKHNLNYKQSEIDNHIAQLKAKYQKGGASTIISAAKSPEYVPLRQSRTETNTHNTNPETGEKIDRLSSKAVYEKTKVNKDGTTEVVQITRKEKSTKMAETNDAYTLTSGGSKENPGTKMEDIYASYANSMKALANKARKEYLDTPSLKYSPSAKTTYATEVASLNSKLLEAKKNAPKERQAQLLGNKWSEARISANPGIDDEHKSKIQAQELTRARTAVGAKKKRIEITTDEWTAIQAGAISNNKLKEILDNTDLDLVKSYATPRSNKTNLTASKKSLIRSLEARGYTRAEIAQRVGVSTTTVSNVINGKEGFA